MPPKIELDKKEIRKMYINEMMTTREIAKRFGISKTPINRICNELKIVRSAQKRIIDIEKYLLSMIKLKKDDCWEYQAHRGRGGYCRIYFQNKEQFVHRVSYETFIEPIKKGMTVDHLCRNTCCINPDHMEIVTLAENILRGNCPSAINSRKTHCKRGHKLSGNNLLIFSGKRQCRICINKAQLRQIAVVVNPAIKRPLFIYSS